MENKETKSAFESVSIPEWAWRKAFRAADTVSWKIKARNGFFVVKAGKTGFESSQGVECSPMAALSWAYRQAVLLNAVGFSGLPLTEDDVLGNLDKFVVPERPDDLYERE